MGILSETLLGFRQSRLSKERGRARAKFRLRQAHAVRGKGLAKMFPDGEKRIEAPEGILQDHSDFGPPNATNLFGPKILNLPAFERDSSARSHDARGKKARDGVSDHGLSGARFSDEPEDFARVHGERDVFQKGRPVARRTVRPSTSRIGLFFVFSSNISFTPSEPD